MEKEITVVRNYKDTMFRMIFKEKKELLELYNAVNGTHYTNPEDLKVTTLENAVYMTMKNDVSCLLDMRLQLYEQQSTINPNMPLRDLLYEAKQMEILLMDKDIYARKMIKLPTPKFFVFYNGVEEQPERCELRLSDMFEIKEEKPSLELVVTQFNINQGYNEELLRNCPTLFQYMVYTNKVREYKKNRTLEESVQLAVDECIKENVLRDFLLKNKAEVITMSIFEYDEELHKKTLREEGFEDGKYEGERNKQIEIARNMKAKGMSNDLIAEMTELSVEEIEQL